MFGLIRRAKAQLRKAEAASALENLLKSQAAAGNFDGNAHIAANEMIAETWARSAKTADWAQSPLPHKVSLVAIALAERLERAEYGDGPFFAYGISLGVVLNTAFRNAANLGFSPLDELLITSAARVSESVNERLASLPVSQELQTFLKQDDASES